MKLLMRAAIAVVALFVPLIPAKASELEKLKPLFSITTPEGNGPFPVILLVSGCSGFQIQGGGYDEVQSDLTKLGFVALRVDSLEARGEKNCDKQVVTAADQASDISAVVAHLKTLPNIKADAINVLGWSWGGQGALASAQANQGIAKAIAYYPACQRLQPGEIKVPTLILSGEADDVVSLDVCKSLVKDSKLAVLRTYPNAHHAFDNKKFDPPKKYRLGTLGYNEPAAISAWAEIQKFLAR